MINLVKLCVGADSVESLQAWIDWRADQAKAAGQEPVQYHTTRMMPKRVDELLDGGSLYWVIKGNIQVRQYLTDIKPFVDDEGIKRCDLIFDPRLILTDWQPKRPFQGWRYLKPEEAPADLGESAKSLSPELRADLSDLGLL